MHTLTAYHAHKSQAAQCLNDAILDFDGEGTEMSTLELVLRQGQLAMSTLGPFYKDLAFSRIAPKNSGAFENRKPN